MILLSIFITSGPSVISLEDKRSGLYNCNLSFLFIFLAPVGETGFKNAQAILYQPFSEPSTK